MYLPTVEPLTESHQLNQGDIVGNLIRPKRPTEISLLAVKSGNKLVHPPLPEHLNDPNLHVVVRAERVTAMVLSNSCDNAGSYPLWFAPVRNFKFREEGLSPKEQWEDISEAATGLTSIKVFYLAATTGLARSEVVLNDTFSLDHTYVQRCIRDGGATRVCALNPSAVRHLQWAIATMISRDPRDDFDWPSDDDLRLWKAWLEAEIPRASKVRKPQYEAQLAEVKRRLGE